MINLATYTVQTVHGLKDTFQVSANGTVDTGQLFVTGPTSSSTKNAPAANEQTREPKRGETTPKQAR
ncbi:hypothetical protein [Novipirellula rosea]|uniref:Uncharacterized protein n=1 Tax=Novipirellula rosea TaxID=1031540 RepID=A0ABP8NK89_9BACT|tara:strand:- start:4982 stop:5182 length:201 start_codon:yes stop_codon:yes gene_type:complete